MHPFYREYFDKKPKQLNTSFRVKYANSTNEIPGITDAASRQHTKTKEFRTIPEKANLNVKKVINETRMPVKKGQSTAQSTARKHFKLANGWQNEFSSCQELLGYPGDQGIRVRLRRSTSPIEDVSQIEYVSHRRKIVFPYRDVFHRQNMPFTYTACVFHG